MASWLNDFGPLDSVLELERFLAILLHFSWWDIFMTSVMRRGFCQKSPFIFTGSSCLLWWSCQRPSLWFNRKLQKQTIKEVLLAEWFMTVILNISAFWWEKIVDSLTLDLLKRSFSLMKTLHKRLNALSQSCDSLHLLNIVPKFLHSLLLKRKIDTVLILCIKTCLEIFLGVQGK